MTGRAPRPVQYFDAGDLQRCRDMTPDQVIEFLDDFRRLHGAPRSAKSRLISMKVPEDLLNAFRTLAQRKGKPYQTLIKQLMRDWVVRQ